jgi:ribosomal protein S12 methylthiotransferase accessory factor
MARPGKLRAFRFLIDGLGSRSRTYREPLAAGTPEGDLSTVLGLLKRADQPAYAVDITSAECRTAGIVAARAVLPRLLPMTLTRYDQCRGTPRLYQAPAAMGYPVRSERELNSYPVPMA